jgi:predicted nucleic acid-binding protein
LQTERFVLDSYALLAFLGGEEGGEQVAELISKALDGYCQLFMSVINLGEIMYITEREKGLFRAQEVLARVDELPIIIIDVNREQVLAAANIKANWHIAYADCFAVALAKSRDASVVTGDPEFSQLEDAAVIPVTWIIKG